ncbi:MAG: hypothetical protein FWD03_06655 [Defluviitaleaceae bacterium]|nr:hypothetical protein [Defluviitaleaceae bacterium]
MKASDDKINKIIDKILNMPKYRDINIPPETIQSLVAQSLPLSKNPADLEKRVREKIHNIVALYLGDMDYKKAADEFRQIKNDSVAIKAFSQQALTHHASTKERGTELAALYEMLFEKTGKARSIADLACGIHPIGLPFMNLPCDTAYYAYDLNKARADFLNIFITEQGYGGGCFHEDILINPPAIEFDVAFFFKEAQRFEKRQPGALPDFLDSIKASKMVVSVPSQSLGSHQQLFPKYEKILSEYVQHRNWSLDSFTFGNEIFFIINR